MTPEAARRIAFGHPALRSGGLAEVVRIVRACAAPDAAPARERERMLREREHMLNFADEHDDALLRACVPGHFTASALVLDARGERALLTHHRKLRRWLQLGGHCDGEGNLALVALTEAFEESGIEGLAIDPEPIDLDVHVIPARPERPERDGRPGRASEPEHLHLDTRFIVHAPPGAVERASDESLELGWFTPAEARRLDVDASVLRLFARAGLAPR